MDKETKEYIDLKINNLRIEIEEIFAIVRRDMNNVQKKLKKLED